ncbi:hypothetical protein DFP73DRAFT_478350 [Morchella snyderi]|nr:hypothetical protein DFP73DRAFT_478350 [Morchella snyderi]
MSSVRIELDNRGGTFTCLDYVTGRVIMNINTEETISAITVKMEGISRTRLIPPRSEDGRDSKRAEIEIHRLLYLVETVFPSAEIRENTSASHTGYTLKAGQYEYPFRIRIPINSNCTEAQATGAGSGLLQKISFDKGNIDFAKKPTRHVQGTLPPSLSGVPGDLAWIRYFLKVTVNRPQFYRINMRAHDPFVFLPIEPPRALPSAKETYAKRQHQMIYTPSPVPSPAKKRGGILAAFRPTISAPTTPLDPPETHHVHFSIEVRLPAPPILVPNTPLPLRIILTKLQPYRQPVFIRSLQIVLHAYTEITAHELRRTDHGVIPVLSLGDLRTPLGAEYSPVNVELEADPNLWMGASLPDTVPPAFRTCNIWRTYQLEVVMGLSHGFLGQIEMIPLTMPIEVYSGIAPPQKLLDSTKPPFMPPPRKALTGKSATSLTVPTAGAYPVSHSEKNTPMSSPVVPDFPKRPHSFSGEGKMAPPPPPVPAGRPHSSAGGEGGSGGAGSDELPPPTYEDALADDIGPVDGPRRRYEQQGEYYGALPDDVR